MEAPPVSKTLGRLRGDRAARIGQRERLRRSMPRLRAAHRGPSAHPEPSPSGARGRSSRSGRADPATAWRDAAGATKQPRGSRHVRPRAHAHTVPVPSPQSRRLRARFFGVDADHQVDSARIDEIGDEAVADAHDAVIARLAPAQDRRFLGFDCRDRDARHVRAQRRARPSACLRSPRRPRTSRGRDARDRGAAAPSSCPVVSA